MNPKPLVIIALYLTSLCMAQVDVGDLGSGVERDEAGYLEHEYGYTKEETDAYLRHVLERSDGITRRSVDSSGHLSASSPGKSLQDLIDAADDGSTRHVPSGYYDLDQTLHIAKNLTLIGNGSVVIDAKDDHQILEVEKGISVRIKNIAFVNGNGSYGGAISTKAKELFLETLSKLFIPPLGITS